MRIAVNAADLDHARIDGTRIYIQNLLKNFGPAARERRGEFLIYHKSEFNPDLIFPVYKNYRILKKPFPFWWTQTRFAWEIFREKPDVLWMPMHSLPFFRSKKIKTVVTIHDLAFKIFPHYFPKKDLRRLNFFTDYAVRKADKLIAISKSTKSDLLKIYPDLREEKIKVIYHGYDKELFNENIPQKNIKEICFKYQIPDTKYIVCVGTLQPRKNIAMLIDVFECLRRQESYKDLKLVVAGDQGWMHEGLIRRIETNPNILYTGRFETKDLPSLIRGAEILVFPSLYEGFGLPALEAMACGVPVVAANNSSLAEIVEGSGLLFDAHDEKSLRGTLIKVLNDDKLKHKLKLAGLEKAKNFSWEKCANETLKWLMER